MESHKPKYSQQLGSNAKEFYFERVIWQDNLLNIPNLKFMSRVVGGQWRTQNNIWIFIWIYGEIFWNI